MVGYDKDSKLTKLDFALAGGGSGFITRAICQPLDVLKIRFQLQVEPISNHEVSKYRSIFQAVGVILREEGPKAFWKGHIPAQWLSVMYGVGQFCTFEILSRQSARLNLPHNYSPFVNFTCGSIAGGVATLVSFPFDVIRTRLVAQSEQQKIYKGVVEAGISILRNEGPFVLFRGLLPTVLQIGPHAGAQFMCYKIFSDLYLKKTTANGHITSEAKNEKSPAKEAKKSPAKDVSETPKQKDKKADNKQSEKNKKNETLKAKTIEEAKNKKNLKKPVVEKPVDYDDGDWETVFSKGDKKKKQELSPAKKDKKNKKNAKIENAEIDKFVKEVVNKELREKEKEVKVAKKAEEESKKIEAVIEAPVVEEKKEKKEKKAKKETAEKVVDNKKATAPKEQPKVEVAEEKVDAKQPASGAAFDELGDVWTEAKVPKKSKKKARRDN